MTPRPLGEVWHWREDTYQGCAVFISLGKESALRFTFFKTGGEVVHYHDLVYDGSSHWHAPKRKCNVPSL